MLKRITLMTGGLLVALLLLLSINVLAGTTLRSSRFDLTENKLYTLSDGAKAVLSKIDEPITLRFYFSKELAQDYPPLPSYGQRVEELLMEFESHANGKLKLEVLEPEPFTEVEDRAVQSGLQGLPLPSGETLYFGLAGTNTIGDEEMIPFFSPEKESFLEYDVAKLVYGLSNPERGVVGLLSSLPIEGAAANPMTMRQNPPQPWFVVDQIRQLHEVQTIQPDATEIPPEVGVLMIVHPKNLPPQTLYAIDQFVMRGGKALVFVDPFCEADVPPSDPQNPMQSMMAPRNSSLGPLFASWGLEMPEDKLAGDLTNALSVTFNNRGRDEPVDYVIWLGLDPDAFQPDEIVTGELDHMKLAAAGILRPTDGATTQFTPLIQTSDQSMEIATSQVQFGPNPPGLLADFFPSGKRLALAARVSGPAKSAFPDGPPKADDEEAEAPAAEHLTESDGPINVIVVADADMLADRWWVNVQNFGGMRLGMKTADNGDFVTNAIDYLHGSTDLISLRGRGDSDHPFEVVRDLEAKAQLAYRAEEQRLVEELDRTENELRNLQTQGDGQSAVLQTPESLAAIDRLRTEQVNTRKRLREVRANLRRDIESLGNTLRWLNIGAIPGLVLVFALVMVVIRSNRRRPAQ